MRRKHRHGGEKALACAAQRVPYADMLTASDFHGSGFRSDVDVVEAVSLAVDGAVTHVYITGQGQHTVSWAGQ